MPTITKAQLDREAREQQARAAEYVQRNRATLCWHQLFGWPVLRELEWRVRYFPYDARA